jgi:hypothetical protein
MTPSGKTVERPCPVCGSADVLTIVYGLVSGRTQGWLACGNGTRSAGTHGSAVIVR